MEHFIQNQGVLFSNADHNVIFLNKALQKMLDFPMTANSLFIGKPAHKILGVSEEIYKAIVREIMTRGEVNDLEIELTSQSGDTLQMLAQGVSNKDNRQNLIGIDYSFRIRDIRGKQVLAESSEVPIDMVHEIVRYYFKRQMEGLYQTMTQWGGKKLGNLLNEVINSTAQQQNWNIHMEGEKVIDNASALRFDSYHGLLNKGAATVASVLGKSIMHKQINSVNSQTNPTTFEYIEDDWHTKF